MLSKPITCAGCPLYNLGEGFSTPEGTGKNGVLILGEALGSNEKYDGKPFRPYAESGSVLEAALNRLGLRREDFALYNVVNCQPPQNKLAHMYYEQEAVENCSRYVKNLINKVKPKVILALGDVGLRYTWAEYPELLDKIKDIPQDGTDKAFRKKLGITQVRGYILPSIHGIPVIASLHPSFIRRTGMVYLGILIRDIRLAVIAANETLPDYKLNYKVNSIDKIKDFIRYAKENPQLPISYDIETPYSTLEADEKELDYKHIQVRNIDSIQFSIKEGEAIYLTLGEEKDSPNWYYTKIILGLPNPKVGWNNWSFDEVNIKYHLGNEYPAGTNIDGMWMAKWWNQDFGSSKLTSHGLGLQWNTSLFNEGIPLWKHLSISDEFYYGCIDVDTTLRNFNALKKEFENRRLTQDCYGKEVKVSKTLLQGFMDDIVGINPILKAASRRGFPINTIAREEYKDNLRKEIKRVNKELQAGYPNELRRRDPLKGFKNVPKEITEITEIVKGAFDFKKGDNFLLPIYINEDCNNNSEPSIHCDILDKNHKQLVQVIARKLTKKKDMSGLVLRNFKLDSGIIQERWCRLHKFKVGSKQQVLAYIHHKKYKLRKKKNQETKKFEETTSKDMISQLWEETKDSLLGNIIYLRELNKLKSTYVGEKFKTLDIDEDGIGRYHSEFGYWPVTGQLSSRNPNIQNLPKYGGQWATPQYRQLAKDYRKLTQAKRGHLLLEADYKSFHALTLAFEAEDADYMRLVRADVHSFVAAHIIRNEFEIQNKALRGRLIFLKVDTPERKKVISKLSEIEETLDYLKDLDNWLAYSDSELKEKLKWIKKNYEFQRNRQAKPGILGLGYGMGAKRLYEENIRSFKDVADANRVILLLRKLFPKLFIFHDKIRKMADKKGYLISRYGYLERFYNVYDYRVKKPNSQLKFGEEEFTGRDGRKWIKKSGTDSENAIAFYPANDAFGKIKEAMRELDEVGAMEKYNFINQIHDSLIFECREDLIDECGRIVKEIMERPSKYLVNSIAPNGLICAVDISIGKNWASYNDDEKKGPLNLEGLKEINI